jgi:hypothetical protein
MRTDQLNAVYSTRSMKRRYEVWFLRCGLADATGAWWFRYLLMNLGRNGCDSTPTTLPVQIWATWFPRCDRPQTFIQGFPMEALELSPRGKLPFHFHIAENGINENSCWGDLRVDGHSISWKLRYHSDFGITLSDKGWIGFSKSPHSNTLFSGQICLDGRLFAAEPLGFGVQGHNCGYRHRTYWSWMHAYFPATQGAPTTLEALVYDMPFGMVFRKAVLWHCGKPAIVRRIQETAVQNDANRLKWAFRATTPDGTPLEASVEARAPGIHHLDYARTDCSGTFPVANASLACAQLRFGANATETLETETGAVLEMGG